MRHPKKKPDFVINHYEKPKTIPNHYGSEPYKIRHQNQKQIAIENQFIKSDLNEILLKKLKHTHTKF